MDSPGQQTYGFIHAPQVDADKSGYRLKMVDQDSRFTYSPVIKIDRNRRCQGALEITSLYPAPFTDKIIVHYCTGDRANLDAILIDMSGRIVVQKNFLLPGGQGSFASDDLGRLSKGIYMLVVKDENGNRSVKKIIK